MRPTLVAAIALLSLSGCRRSERAQGAPVAPAASATASVAAVPVDRVGPDELGEGSTVAFGLPLPRDAVVRGRFDDVVRASSTSPAEVVANYVRQRVEADHIYTGPRKTVFERAVVKDSAGHDGGAPAAPGRLVSISVVSFAGGSELEVRDVTPKPSRPGLSSDERWREQGVNPDGTLADPEHLR